MRKTVLITGASRGIGRAIAVAFAKADYNLVITCSRSESELLSLKDELETVYSVDVLAVLATFLIMNMLSACLHMAKNVSMELMCSLIMLGFLILD